MIKYRMNLVKSLRMAEKRAARYRTWAVFVVLAGLAALALSGFFVFLRVTEMELALEVERSKLKAIEAEYEIYQEMQAVIDKADIELLNQIQTDRIYWTKILEAMASHLPEEDPISYWITKFGYRSNTYSVQGFGYITERQEQLLALDNYLNKLRTDANYSSAFGSTYLKSATRSDESDRGTVRERVSFEYASLRKGMARR
ncbi:MAG: hypothetical protein FWC23_08190 [Chitinispirillia bacterium]|nr:hypothetical protein [Chitinispirillia bacterium]MCL2269152.1 hypothetical protein [Chitinispirillia bacterium]